MFWEMVKYFNIFRRKAAEYISILFGAGLLLLLFKGGCLEFSAALEAIVFPVEKAIVLFSEPFIFFFQGCPISFSRPATAK